MPGGIVIGGDGRADSPGHSAKFGSYTTMELRLNKVIDIQLVQSNEVGGSYHMELEGLKRSIEFLWQNDLVPSVIISDRHASIQKWVRENMPNTQHYYDVWHVAKGVTKKMEQLANQKDCELVRKWIRSVSNHMYYSAASSEGESGDMVVAKWKSVVWHMQNIHEGHDDPLFDKCTHLPLDSDNQRMWLKPNTKACEKVANILLNKKLLSDVKKLSPLQQTSSVEAFHSLVIQFAPKSVALSFRGMYCRSVIYPLLLCSFS
jgi:Transposase